MSLLKRGLVKYEDCLRYVSNPDDFALRFKGISATSDGTWEDFEKSTQESEVDITEDPILKIDRF